MIAPYLKDLKTGFGPRNSHQFFERENLIQPFSLNKYVNQTDFNYLSEKMLIANVTDFMLETHLDQVTEPLTTHMKKVEKEIEDKASKMEKIKGEVRYLKDLQQMVENKRVELCKIRQKPGPKPKPKPKSKRKGNRKTAKNSENPETDTDSNDPEFGLIQTTLGLKTQEELDEILYEDISNNDLLEMHKLPEKEETVAKLRQILEKLTATNKKLKDGIETLKTREKKTFRADFNKLDYEKIDWIKISTTVGSKRLREELVPKIDMETGLPILLEDEVGEEEQGGSPEGGKGPKAKKPKYDAYMLSAIGKDRFRCELRFKNCLSCRDIGIDFQILRITSKN